MKIDEVLRKVARKLLPRTFAATSATAGKDLKKNQE
jgi:hypothetical protein